LAELWEYFEVYDWEQFIEIVVQELFDFRVSARRKKDA
jgi:hypothetical protein